MVTNDIYYINNNNNLFSNDNMDLESFRRNRKAKKGLFILIGVFAIYLITLLVNSFAQNGIEFEKEAIAKEIKNILVLVFTGLNAMIVLPFIARTLEKVDSGEIEKDELSKKIVILIIIFIICMIIECNYMKNTQEGILEIYQAIKK